MKQSEDWPVHSLKSFEVGELVWAKNSYRQPQLFWPSVVVDPEKHAPEPYKKHSYRDRLLVMYYGPSTTQARPRDFYWMKQGDILPWKDYLQTLQKQRMPKKDLEQAFHTALDEALSAEARYRQTVPGDEVNEDEEPESTATCVACGVTLTPVEEESYQSNDGKCFNCLQHYQDDSPDSYVCPMCRPAPNPSPEALAEYEERLREMRPCPPRTPFLLFSYEMIRVYRGDNSEHNLVDMLPIMRAQWLNMSTKDREEYRRAADEEARIFAVQKLQHDQLFDAYQSMAMMLGAPMDVDVVPEDRRLALPAPHRSVKRERDMGLADEGPSEKKAKITAVKREVTDDFPAEVTVVCQGMRGLFQLASQKVMCLCKDCSKKPPEQREFTPTQFENHCGAGSAKKWKASLRVEPGCVPEVPPDAAPMQIGRWLDMKGIEIGKPKPLGEGDTGRGKVAMVGPQRPPGPGPRKSGDTKPERKQEPTKPWFEGVQGSFRPIKVRWAGDRCSVCDSDIDYDYDQLVSCDMCGITVHQSCYGVPEPPGPDDMWLCRACELKEVGKPSPQCCLCPVAGGALKPTTLVSPLGSVWCHASCMQWIPEVTCLDPTRMEPIDRIQYIQKERWELNCSLCKQRMGAKVQCSNCYVAFHPLCARMAGLHMEMVDPKDGEGPLQLVAYCPRHCTPTPELSGVQVMREEGGEADVGDGAENGLCNGQPFSQPPALEVPECSAGCARGQALDAERVFHGTGAGWTSKKGFWMPERPPDLPELAPVGGVGGLPPRPPKHPLSLLGKAPKDRKTVPLLPGGKRKPSRASKGASMPPTRPPRAAANDGPPPAVQLLPLPEDVPDSVGVQCNGRRGVMLLRTQHVMYNGQEVSASRFEQLAGRGEAKKWKASLWAEDANGDPECPMQEWLDDRGLDRKMLANLAANATAWEAHQSYVERQARGENGREEADDAMDAASEGPSDGGEAPMEEDEPKARPQEPPREPGRPLENGHTSAESQQPPPQQPQPQHLHPLLSREDVMMETPPSKGYDEDGALGAMFAARAARLSASGVDGMDMDVGEPGSSGRDLFSRRRNRGRKQAMPRSSLPGHVTSSAAGSSATGGGTPGQHMAQNGGAVAGQDTEAVQEAESSAPKRKLIRLNSDKLDLDLEMEPELPSSAPPEARVGSCCRVYWPEDREWYEADVRGYDSPRGQHLLWYHLDEEEEWLDLAGEAREGRLQWLPNVDRSRWPAAPPVQPPLAVPAPAKAAAVAAAPGAVAEAAGAERTPQLANGTAAVAPEVYSSAPPPPASSKPPAGAGAVGWRIGVWWVDDGCHYYAVIEDHKEGRHQVHYDDDALEWLDLTQEKVEWVQPNGHEIAAAARRAAADRAAAEAAVPVAAAAAEPMPGPQAAAAPREASGPTTFKVICNGLTATFDTARMCVILEKGREVSPTEFERMAGKASSKKWKTSVRVAKSDGTPGITMETWLLENGLDTGRAPRPTSDAPGGPPTPSLDAIRRRQSEAARRTHERKQAQMDEEKGRGGGGGAGGGLIDPLSTAPSKLRGHRESCMCIICKQARRKSDVGGEDYSPGAAGEQLPPASTRAGPSGRSRLQETWKVISKHTGTSQQARPVRGPQLRFGKRAYVCAVPQLPRGAMQHRWWSTPSSKSWTADEWLAARSQQQNPGVAAAAAAAQIPQGRPAAAMPPQPPATVATAGGAEGEDVVVLASGGSSRAALRMEKMSKAVTFKERLRQSLLTERERVTFGKSGIHGWGFFAKKDMAQDSMVIQYRGEVVRPVVADLREARYRAQGKDCYLFHVTDNVVIDSTQYGAFGRFTNHCCSPSMYTRVVEMEGEVYICFFARTDIRAGQELTYDYRFKEEAGDAKVFCQCGAPNCRGTLN